MATKHNIGSVDEIGEGDRKITEIEGQEIAVFNIEGEYHALANYCPHELGPVCEGPIVGKITAGDDHNWKYDGESNNVICPWHYWKFDVPTGAHVKDDRYKIPKYDVEVENGEIFVVR